MKSLTSYKFKIFNNSYRLKYKKYNENINDLFSVIETNKKFGTYNPRIILRKFKQRAIA